MAYRTRKLMAEINVVPYIDVMLVLLIIFMVTVPLIQQGVEVDLPRASAELMDPSQIPNPLIVTVDRRGQASLNRGAAANRPLSPQLLYEQINLLLPDAAGEIYVRGDRHADYGSVIAVMVALQNAGAENIGLITQPSEN